MNGIHKFCSTDCRYKYYGMHAYIKSVKNPLGIIQNVTINYTLHVEGKGNKKNDEVVWFIQNRRVGCLNLDLIKERNYEVSDVLLHNGYEIDNCSEFDENFQKIMMTLKR